MDICPIQTDADYKVALRELSAYFDNEPEPGTPDGDRFEVLLTLVEAFEAKLPPERTKLGSMLASIAREAGGLTDAEAEAINQLRDKEPAIPVGETSPHEIGGLSPSDQQCIAQALLAPPPQSPALGRAFARLRDLQGEGGEETRETLALLNILALGNQDVAAGKADPVADVVARLRAKWRRA